LAFIKEDDMYHVGHFINGKKIVSKNPSLNIYQPATGSVIGQVELADSGIVNQAVAAALAAFPQWSETTPLKRARILFQFKAILEKNIEALAKIVTREHGKTLADARGSVQRGIDVVEFACGIPAHLKGSYTENVGTEIDSYSVRQPLGVCVGMTPFNFPAMVPLWMFPMAIACGNTFVLKPSEKDPSCALYLAELAKKAGLPDGVLNVVQGQKETVESLIHHPDVKAISFVGSTPIAEFVYREGTAQGKRVQAFGGAKNHAVLMPDADLDQAIDAIMGAAYGSAGERCMAISVVIAVGDALADQFIQQLKPRVANLKIGSGENSSTDMGPLVTKEHWEKVKSYIDLGEKEGASLIVDGRTFHEGNGFYMGGSLFDRVIPTMRIYKEEIFGPVLSVVRVPDFATALHLVNSHAYGNGAAIFTRDGGIARTFATKVETGMVGINIPIPVPVAYHSFGGWKRSMFGDIHMHGPEAIHFYTRLKTITQRWLHKTTGANFSMPTHL
jgi:malonate-semialdehyde dehydrogenase (acetylating)/methylmalonate-semialdehyde dehydrogenase